MPDKIARIQDEPIRGAMAEAKQALRSGDYRRVVELSSDSYVELLRRKPEMLEGAAQIMSVMFFPRLGAHLQLNSQRQPEIIWDRETFSFAEAVTYFEYAVDSLVKQGL